MSKKNIIQIGNFAIIILLVFIVSVWNIELQGKSGAVIGTFILNGATWTFLLLHNLNKRSFSFHFMHWLFNLMFLFVSPLVQYLNDCFVYRRYITFSDDLIVKTNYILLLWTICFCVGSVYTNDINRNGKMRSISAFQSEKYRFTQEGLFKMKRVLLVLSFISIGVTFYRLVSVGFLGLLSHATSDINYGERGISSLINSLMRSTVYYSVAFSIVYYKMSSNKSFLIINSICLLISYFPTGSSRFIAAAIYLGLFLTFSEKCKINKSFSLIMLLALFVIWPFMNSFRHNAFLDVDILQGLSNTIKAIPTFWCDGDFDAFSITMCSIKYVDFYGNTMLKQLLGVSLFFIPRSIWPEKPIGSGAFIAEKLSFIHTNVSNPLPAEGYVNLGIVGVVLFGLLFGYGTQKIDDCYWNICTNNERSNGIHSFEVLYPVVMTLFFIMSRGDLLSSFSHVFAFFVTWFIIAKCILNKRNIKERSSIE